MRKWVGYATVLTAAIGVFGGCRTSEPKRPEQAEQVEQAVGAAPASAFDRLARADFNRRAVECFQPLFWRSDSASPGELTPDELVVTWTPALPSRSELIDASNAFTPAFAAVYDQLVQPEASGLGPEEAKRREAVRRELSQGRPTLIENDFANAPETDGALVRHLLQVSVLVERLYARQKGTLGLETQIAPGDAASAAMFFRNQGPLCKAPKTEKDPDCHALPAVTPPVFGLYPSTVQSDPAFCRVLKSSRTPAS